MFLLAVLVVKEGVGRAANVLARNNRIMVDDVGYRYYDDAVVNAAYWVIVQFPPSLTSHRL